jgi:Domain of unknown function (DUF4411)
MKKYCFDTSGISTPLELMPEDIHKSAWASIKALIASGIFAVTAEIYDEMTHITGTVGECIIVHKGALILEVGEGEWDWESYTKHTTRMQDDYKQFISEFNYSLKSTVCITDISIIALAKTLAVPLVQMESAVNNDASKKRRIPDICKLEEVDCLHFSQFCRKESLTF